MNSGEEQWALTGVSRRLALLRWFMVMGLGATIGVVHFGFGITLQLTPMVAGVATLLLLNASIYWRLSGDTPMTQHLVFLQLLVDVAVLSVLLYYAGGSSNPFVSLYLLPLVVTAVLLSRTHALVMAAATVVCYSLLMVWHVPLPLQHFRLHIIGMWCNFILSAGLIVFFVAHLAAVLRSRERELTQARERALRNEHIVALGTLAAGAAHELATPLSTMAVLSREMQADADADADSEQAANLRCLREQVDACKSTLARLRGYSPGAARIDAADAWLRQLTDDWRLVRPAVALQWRWLGSQPAPPIHCDEGLGQTLINLINNAADASPQGVAMQGDAIDGELVIEIRDSGAGVAAEIAARASRAADHIGSDGHGMGLLLAHATAERLGGRIQWFDRAGGGLCTRLAVPLHRLGTI